MNLTLMISYTLIKFLNENILFLALISLSAFNTETIRTPFLGVLYQIAQRIII